VPLLDKHHWLLVTLLVVNAAAMETLPILLDNLVPSYVAIIMSVTLVLIAGEIIPQAVCTNRPLLIGAFFAPFIRVLMWFTSPVSYPMARLLDWILGDDCTVRRRAATSSLTR
jgi:metal transporter CNNM